MDRGDKHDRGRQATSADQTLALVRGSLVGVAGVHLATSSIWVTAMASALVAVIVVRARSGR